MGCGFEVNCKHMYINDAVQLVRHNFYFIFFYYKALASNIKGEVDKSGQANFDNTEERGMRADEVGQPPPT